MHSKRDISGHSFTQSQCAGYESDPIRSVRSVTVSSPLVQMKPTTGRDGSRFGTVEQHGTRRGRAHRARYACLLGYPSSHVAGFLVAPPRRPHTVPVHLARQVLLEYYACIVVSWVHQVTPHRVGLPATQHLSHGPRTRVPRGPLGCSSILPPGPLAAATNSVRLGVTGGLCAPKLSSSNRRSGGRSTETRPAEQFGFFFLMIWCTYLKKPLASSTPSTTTTTKEALSMQGNNCDEGRGKKKDAGKDYCCTRISFRP
jgi:hypothetical protein